MPPIDSKGSTDVKTGSSIKDRAMWTVRLHI